jgi:hypothetical protein
MPTKRQGRIGTKNRLETIPILTLSAMLAIAGLGCLVAAIYKCDLAMGVTFPTTEPTGREPMATKNIVELQESRQSSSSSIRSGEVEGTATLINLNPKINIWYLLHVVWKNGSESSYHLENPEPRFRRLFLDPEYPSGIEIFDGTTRYSCSLFAGRPLNFLDQARASQFVYAPLCESRLYLRNPVRGHRTRLESAAEFLRKEVWGGEKVIVLFHHLFEDSYRETGEMREAGVNQNRQTRGGPLPALIDSKYSDRVLSATNLGLALESAASDSMRPGLWYSAEANSAVYVSLIQPGLIDAAILSSYKARVNALDTQEASALCYLVAFDLDHFDLAYAVGTEHPAVYWSRHTQAGIKSSDVPGPDGIGSISPLVATGLVSPVNAHRVVATFTGGFKREHGAFKFGEFSLKNSGSHYGFAVDGVVLSKLQPGLATIFVLSDGFVQMKTWTSQDDQNLSRVKYARQNGVALVEFDERSQSAAPGVYVNNWGAGNWSGSEDMRLRTIRSGAALQWNGGKRFLIYAVFTDATPSAMARVFQAYQCRYGMLLDLNALEHTYFALYRRVGAQLFVDHLISGMAQVEKSDSDGSIPRFLGYPDNRDFFYMMRTNNEKEVAQ